MDLNHFTDRVLLVDDQRIIGEAVRRMLAPIAGLEYRAVDDPHKALEVAREFQPTLILQDLVMPGVDGLDLVRAYRADPWTATVPIVVLSSKEEAATKAEAFARGANDYIVKLPDPVELVARVVHHSRGYKAQLERNAAYAALQESEARLSGEIQKASEYVRSLLDAPMQGDVSADWRFVPSESLGGDVFGYHTIDADHLAMYVLDVSGHGVGPALMGVSAMNLIRANASDVATALDPSRVLLALNAAFPMARHHGMYFTVWYGVYSRSTRELAWSGGGHPPALLVRDGNAQQLESTSYMVGVTDDYDAPTMRMQLAAGDRLYLYSDGVFEIHLPAGGMWNFEEFVGFILETAPKDRLDAMMAHTQKLQGKDRWDDDYSMIDFGFR